MRRFGRPVGNTDSLSFMYYTDTRNARREEETNEVDEVDNAGVVNSAARRTSAFSRNDYSPKPVSAHSGMPLTVERVELYASENASNHRTDKYEQVTEQKNAVLRRSAPFYMAVQTKERPVEIGRDVVRVIFEFGDYPSVPKGTKIVLPLTGDKQKLNPGKSNWDALVHRQSGNNLVMQVQISNVAPVGVWKCKIETSFARGTAPLPTKTYVAKHPIYVIFNPYSKDDSVYMPDESKLSEYIQNDTGKIWKGGYKQFHGRLWIFGQFEDIVLPACCFILDRSGLRPAERGDPIRVSRAISAMVNSVDDDGIVKGKWRAPYDKGTAPWDWSGSVKIIEEYMRTQGRPVSYGQCWVYSAVTVTICRALGLPCRSVTNYVSAHDTNNSLTVDKFFSDEGDELTAKDNPEFGFDSIWNFHVWNDVWMARPDLPPGYGGWQAIDATPQEASENAYQCGPAPVEAVRRGEMGMGFDVPFVFAEVNADICHFVKDVESHWGFKRTKMNKYHVGRLVLTQAVGKHDSDGDRDYEDITDQYKNKEGTQEERMAVYNAVRGVDRAMLYYEVPGKGKEDVWMDLIELDTVKYGEPYKARVMLENRSRETRTLKALLSSSSIYYTGITANQIKKAQGEFILKPGQKDTLALTIHPSEYMGKLVDYCMTKIYTLIRVQETNQVWSEEDDFVLEKPKLKLEVLGRIQQGRLGKIKISFRNPLEVDLTRCKITLECAGAIREIRERVPGVNSLSEFVHTVLVNPRKVGAGTVVATFGSEEMIDVFGSCKINVE